MDLNRSDFSNLLEPIFKTSILQMQLMMTVELVTEKNSCRSQNASQRYLLLVLVVFFL